MRGGVGEEKPGRQDRAAVASLPSHALQLCGCLASLRFVAYDGGGTALPTHAVAGS